MNITWLKPQMAGGKPVEYLQSVREEFNSGPLRTETDYVNHWATLILSFQEVFWLGQTILNEPYFACDFR